jgi:plasmid stabilization system protein ParE
MNSPKYTLGFSPRAASELEQAALWYEEQRKGLGSEFMRAAEAIFASIQRTPMLYPEIHGSARRALLKRFPFGIIFEEHGDVLVVLSVFHLRRRPEAFGKP